MLFPARIFCQMTCGWILPALEIISKVKCYYELQQFTRNSLLTEPSAPTARPPADGSLRSPTPRPLASLGFNKSTVTYNGLPRNQVTLSTVLLSKKQRKRRREPHFCSLSFLSCKCIPWCKSKVLGKWMDNLEFCSLKLASLTCKSYRRWIINVQT